MARDLLFKLNCTHDLGKHRLKCREVARAQGQRVLVNHFLFGGHVANGVLFDDLFDYFSLWW
jgi:hypothetical protein